MPKFDFEIPVPLESQNTFDKIKTFLNSENSFKKFDPNITCTFDEVQKSCQLSGSQFKAELKVKNESADKSKVHIEVDLPFALSLFKGKIKDEIEKAFKKVLT
jgi:Putative polyhydroxyalkanoic acid system protein (PHA_gran_rgn)